MARKKKTHILTVEGWEVYRKAQRNGYSIEGKGKRFSVNRDPRGIWRASWTVSSDYRKRVAVKAGSIEEALPDLLERLFGGGGSEIPSAPEVILAEWKNQISAKAETIAEYHKKAKLFLIWITEEGIRDWGEIRPSHLKRYSIELAKRGLKPNSIRLRVFPVKSSAKWASVEYGYQDFGRGYRPPKEIEHNLRTTPEAEALSLEEVAELLLALASIKTEQSLEVLPGVALQGLSALRLNEVIRLTWSKINLARGTVRIEGEVKNKYSAREIPLPALAVRILSEVETKRGPLLPRYHGNHAAGSYGRAVKTLLGKFKIEMIAADLRDSLQTAAEVGGFSGYVLDRYVGHAPRSIRQRHYTKPNPRDLLEEMRAQVVSRVDQATETVLAKWDQSEKVITLKKAE